MIFFKLDDDYLPSTTIQDFDTIIWTERYQKVGDFQLIVENEISILDKLPLGTLVSHTDTHEVMIVENHEFKRDGKNPLKITVSGRGFETFSENRTTLGSEDPLTDSGTGDAIVEEVLSTRASTVATQLLKTTLEPGTASADNALPNVLVYSDLRVLDSVMDHIIKRGDVYSRVLEYLKLCDCGIKIIRPHDAQTTLDIVIHDGEDLIDTVIFYAQREDLDDANYFWSIRDYKTYAQLAAKTFARLYRHRDFVSNLSGFDRRIVYVDAEDLEGSYSPTGSGDSAWTRAQVEIDQHKQVSLIEAKISAMAKPKFKINYDVGDLVTVFGEFGAAQIMRVTEHILTVDKEGVRGFPSLSIL